jgi:hypothetical protein
MLWEASRALAGHGARLATMISASTTIVLPQRTVRKVNGSASGAAYFATMKPLDHNSAKVRGAAPIKNVVKRWDDMGGATMFRFAHATPARFWAEL